MLADDLTRAWSAGAGPGAERLVVDVDSFVGEVHGYDKQGASFGYTGRRGYHPILATRASSGEVLHIRCRTGSANTARGVAVRRGTDPKGRAGGGDRAEVAARGLGVLELTHNGAAAAGGLDLLDRGPPAAPHQSRHRCDP